MIMYYILWFLTFLLLSLYWLIRGLRDPIVKLHRENTELEGVTANCGVTKSIFSRVFLFDIYLLSIWWHYYEQKSFIFVVFLCIKICMNELHYLGHSVREKCKSFSRFMPPYSITNLLGIRINFIENFEIVDNWIFTYWMKYWNFHSFFVVSTGGEIKINDESLKTPPIIFFYLMIEMIGYKIWKSSFESESTQINCTSELTHFYLNSFIYIT